MKALVFERSLPRFAAARVAGSLLPGAGTRVGPLRLADLDPPELPGAGWERVRPRLAGICGSDLATVDGKSSRYFEPIVSFPFVPGHEVAGELDDGSRALGTPQVAIAAPPIPQQQRLARELGADIVIEPDALSRVVRRAVPGALVAGDQLTDGVDTVLDCVGSDASIEQALQVVAPGGTIVLVGMPGRVGLDLTPLWHREVSLRGAYAYTADDFAKAFELVQDARLERLVSATYPLDRWREAIDHAAHAGARGAVKIAFDLRKERGR